jgi:hypothetical protein
VAGGLDADREAERGGEADGGDDVVRRLRDDDDGRPLLETDVEHAPRVVVARVGRGEDGAGDPAAEVGHGVVEGAGKGGHGVLPR